MASATTNENIGRISNVPHKHERRAAERVPRRLMIEQQACRSISLIAQARRSASVDTVFHKAELACIRVVQPLDTALERRQQLDPELVVAAHVAAADV
jgi:hypothetical protein